MGIFGISCISNETTLLFFVFGNYHMCWPSSQGSLSENYKQHFKFPMSTWIRSWQKVKMQNLTVQCPKTTINLLNSLCPIKPRFPQASVNVVIGTMVSILQIWGHGSLRQRYDIIVPWWNKFGSLWTEFGNICHSSVFRALAEVSY